MSQLTVNFKLSQRGIILTRSLFLADFSLLERNPLHKLRKVVWKPDVGDETQTARKQLTASRRKICDLVALNYEVAHRAMEGWST